MSRHTRLTRGVSRTIASLTLGATLAAACTKPRPVAERPRRVLTPAETFVLTDMLRAVVEEGTAGSVRRLGRQFVGQWPIETQ